jgi:preprotein translocase subunit YajC
MLAAFVALPLFAQGSDAAAPAPDPAQVSAPVPAPKAAPAQPSQEPAPAQNQSGGGGGSNFLFIMIAMFAIIYFVMIRPEQKKQKERQKMLSALKKGDRILTVGGVIGVIVSVKESSYVVKSGEGAVIEFSKSAVQSLLAGDGAAAAQTAAQDSGGKDK